MGSGNGIITTGTRIAVVVIPYRRMKTNMGNIAIHQITAQTAGRRWMVIPMYDELINKLYHCANEVFCNKCSHSPDCAGEKTIIREAADAIEDLEKSLAIALLEYQIANNKRIMTEEYAKQKQRWIPVTERLPEDRNMVLATVDGVVRIAFYGNYMWEEIETYSIFYPTHWMPIPQAPESEGK